MPEKEPTPLDPNPGKSIEEVTQDMPKKEVDRIKTDLDEEFPGEDEEE